MGGEKIFLHGLKVLIIKYNKSDFVSAALCQQFERTVTPWCLKNQVALVVAMSL